MLKITKRTTDGFTIVELLIVIVVIAILAAITIVAYNGIQQRAQAARLLSEINSISKKLELFNAEFSNYPVAVDDCPTPAADSLCMTPPSDETYAYAAIAMGNIAGSNGKVINNAYQAQINGSGSGVFYSNAEITSSAPNEFVQYADLSPLIDKCGLKKYKLSFDIKSANIASRSIVMVYFQNGSTAKYGGLNQNVNVTTSYVHYDLTFTATLNDSAVVASKLAFYGNYGTGNIPYVKNVQLTLAP